MQSIYCFESSQRLISRSYNTGFRILFLNFEFEIIRFSLFHSRTFELVVPSPSIQAERTTQQHHDRLGGARIRTADDVQCSGSSFFVLLSYVSNKVSRTYERDCIFPSALFRRRRRRARLVEGSTGAGRVARTRFSLERRHLYD